MSKTHRIHKVRPGDCISSIALKYGLFWEQIWEDSSNSELKKLRKDPNILYKGDVVNVPLMQKGEERVSDKNRHSFVRKGVPDKLKLRFLEEPQNELGDSDEEDEVVSANGINSITEEKEQEQESQSKKEAEPRSAAPYSIQIDGDLITGNLDDDGVLEISIPPNAKIAKLLIDAGTDKETNLEINLGHLDPIDKPLGAKQRLANLSYECGDRNKEETDGLSEAIRRFQEDNDMEVTGKLDEKFKDKLLEIHES